MKRQANNTDKAKTKKGTKNICTSTLRGKPCWIVNLTVAKGRRIKRYFPSETLAKAFLKDYKAAQQANIADIAEMTPLQLADIRTAISLLPNSMTLSECVKLAANRTIPSKTIKEVVVEFLALKEPNLNSQYYQVVKGRLRKFTEAITTFEAATSEEVMTFCKTVSSAPKTQRHYISLFKEFFDFVARKGYYSPNPFDRIHDSELPKLKRKAYKIPSVADFRAFFADIEESAPGVAGLYALVAFGGFRVAEAQRLTLKNFNFDKREILLSFKHSKTNENWLQANMPDNVWTWIKKYPPNETWTSPHMERPLKGIKDKLKFERNALRHSFATYHLSLYREAHKTQILMRHRNSAQLWQTYLAGLVSKEEAESYFAIKPKAYQPSHQSGRS